MGKEGTAKKLLEYNDVFVDVCNNLCFGGKEILREDELIALPTVAYTKDANGQLRERNRDVRKSSLRLGGECWLISELESQMGIDHTMPLRVMGYEYAAYEEQIDHIREKNRKSGHDPGSRRIFANQKLIPVMTAVLYFGKQRWKSPLRLHDMFELEENFPEEVKRFIEDHSMNLIQVAYLTVEERNRLTSDFRLVAEYMAHQNSRESWNEFLNNHNYKIKHMEALLDTLYSISKDEKFYDLLERIKKNTIEEEWTMRKMATELHLQGKEEGRREGRREGKREGKRIGRNQGFDMGLRMLETIKKHMNEGLGKSEIIDRVEKQFPISREMIEKYYEIAVK